MPGRSATSIRATLLAWTLTLAWSLAAAQTPQAEADRALLLRQQQQDEISLRQHQFSEHLRPGLTAGERLELQRRQLEEQHRQQAQHQTQARRLDKLRQTLPHQPPEQAQRELITESLDRARQRTEPAPPP